MVDRQEGDKFRNFGPTADTENSWPRVDQALNEIAAGITALPQTTREYLNPSDAFQDGPPARI